MLYTIRIHSSAHLKPKKYRIPSISIEVTFARDCTARTSLSTFSVWAEHIHNRHLSSFSRSFCFIVFRIFSVPRAIARYRRRYNILPHCYIQSHVKRTRQPKKVDVADKRSERSAGKLITRKVFVLDKQPYTKEDIQIPLSRGYRKRFNWILT